MGSNTTPVPSSGVSGLDGKFALAQQTQRFQPPSRPIDSSDFNMGPGWPQSEFQVLSEWFAVVVTVATDLLSAVVLLSGDTEPITVPVEVAGVQEEQTVVVRFGPDGKVALQAVVV